ncbi:hypothetical protein [Erythrobacter rubeus]|uniref:Secreted protein n=1 Tax=Erythrobacter rubeus TaxID=2760803 RepID=A0ABR8KT85_9SPHN|nr:hypothetical protein [Erythrobacter rubeus]MBD2841351.1 hypothetical protein [Erythrobacter rubeus]
MLLSTLAPIVSVVASLQVHKSPERPPIVVQGNAATPEPLPEPATYFQRHCFDRQRLRQAHTPIDDDYDWQLLPPDLREQWGVKKSVPAYILDYPHRDQKLLIKFESIARDDGLFDQVCTMIVYGRDGHARFRRGLARIMRGSPATNHVGALEGFETIPGWGQWIWTGKFARRSELWKAYQNARNRPTYLVVVDQSYYQRNDYLVLDLKTRSDDDAPLSIARLTHRSRDIPATPLASVSQQE